MVLFNLLLFQIIGSQFLSIGSWMSELVAFQFIWSVAKFLLWISMDDGTFSYVLSSFGFNVETDVGINGCFALFGFSGCTTWIWPLGLNSDGSDGEHFLCGCFWWLSRRIVSVECFRLIGCKISTRQPISRFAFGKFRFGAIHFIIFSEVFIEDSNGRWDINSIVLSFFGFMVEAVVEVGESSAWIWPFGTRC